MKILFALPGHLRTVPMGQFCLDALNELGHEVRAFDYRDLPSEKLADRLGKLFSGHNEEKPAMNRRLRRVIDAFQPDIFVTLFGFDVSRETLAYLRHRRVPSACWWINDPFQFARSAKKAANYDFLFSNSAGSIDDYHAMGIHNAYFLPTACDPRMHRHVPPLADYITDVCFAGDWSPLRQQLMETIAACFDVKIFGPWKKKLPTNSPLHRHLRDGFFTPAEMACMFSSAKVVLNLHTWYGRFDHGVNPRLFEAAGCGTYQLVDWKREIPELFDCGTEVRTYRTFDDIPDLITEALHNELARQSVASAAQHRAYSQHTYRHRMDALLEIVGAAGGR